MYSSFRASAWQPALFATALCAVMDMHSAYAQSDPPMVAVAETETFGAHLTDARGRPLYLFTADRQGTRDGAPQSTCYEVCARIWPPLISRSGPIAGAQADRALLGTVERKDGSRQVTYNGWPLYNYVKDVGSSATGQDSHGFGGEWYLVTPDGHKLESER